MPPKLTEDTFVARASLKHSNLYSYVKGSFTDMKSSIRAICSEHGEFVVSSREHLFGRGTCPKCRKVVNSAARRLSQQEFLQRSISKHGSTYSYDKAVYKGNDESVAIICPTHGIFRQVPHLHWAGAGCVKCARENRKITFKEFEKRAKQIHGDKYKYVESSFTTIDHKLTIICPAHGEFVQRAIGHTNLKRGCRACADQGSRGSKEAMLKVFKSVHGKIYNYSKSIYTTYKEPMEIVCRKHGPFSITPSNHILGSGCPRCATIISRDHQKLIEALESRGTQKEEDFLINDRKALKPLELDLYFPKRHLGVEVNGIYWHAGYDEHSLRRTQTMHGKKHTKALEKGITLLQFTDYEVQTKLPIVLSIIEQNLGATPTRIQARKCTIKRPTKEETKSFLEANHIQGAVGSTIDIGLYYQDELVQLMTFGKSRLNKNYQFELLRLCSKVRTIIAGGSQRIFKHFVDNYLKVGDKLISYCDISRFSGNVYEKLGFTYQRTSAPNYWYTKGKILESRLKFQKHKLKRIVPIFDPAKTERQNMLDNGYRVYFDCGNSVWEYKKQ